MYLLSGRDSGGHEGNNGENVELHFEVWFVVLFEKCKKRVGSCLVEVVKSES